MHGPDTYLEDVLMHLREPVEGKGPAGAAVVDGDKAVYATALNQDRDEIVHMERHALEQYVEEHGEPVDDAYVVTTLSPCALPDAKRAGCSCVDLLLGDTPHDVEITEVYVGHMDRCSLTWSSTRNVGWTSGRPMTRMWRPAVRICSSTSTTRRRSRYGCVHPGGDRAAE